MEYREIPLSGGRAFAIVDATDYPALSSMRWVLLSGKGPFYASHHTPMKNGKRHDILMHRLLMGAVPGDGSMVDHVNGNSLDNRRSNLRFCTPQQNQWNIRGNKANKSGYRGVSKTASGRFLAQLVVNGKAQCLGTFPTPEDARRVYAAKIAEVAGEFAWAGLSDIGKPLEK